MRMWIVQIIKIWISGYTYLNRNLFLWLTLKKEVINPLAELN